VPPASFAIERLGDGVNLWSELMVDAPHGMVDEGNEVCPASGSAPSCASWRQSAFEAVASGTVGSSSRSFIPPIGRNPWKEQTTLSGRPAKIVTSGSTDTFSRHVLIELGPRRTVLIKIDLLGGECSESLLLPRRLHPVGMQHADIADKMLSVHPVTP
jgi:hypothetical protein